MTKQLCFIKQITFLFTLAFTLSGAATFGQKKTAARIDSLLEAKTQHPFNGVIIIAQNGKFTYSKSDGFADVNSKAPLKTDSQFILASISKQITAVLVLRERDKGRLQVSDTIKKYLPDLKQSWADSVTIHQLLNHTSGIVALDKALAFKPGTQFLYSPGLTYQILGKIIEKTSGTDYADLAKELFNECRMKNTTTPTLYKNGSLANNYVTQNEGILRKNTFDLKDLAPFTPGVGIISTAADLVIWNECLHKGMLLSKESYKLMVTGSTTREHSIWGKAEYGYGIQIKDEHGVVEIGHSGAHKGYNSINFYYPASNTSVVVLSNVDWHAHSDIKQSFYFHSQIYQIVRESELKPGN